MSYHNPRIKQITATCPICGKSFRKNETNKRQKYCSRDCMVKSGVLKAKAEREAVPSLNPLAPIACKSCGKEFVPKSKRVVYCSSECSRAGKWAADFRKKHDREPTKDEILGFMYWAEYGEYMDAKTCANCGKDFHPLNKGRRGKHSFCSAKCRKNFYHVRSKELMLKTKTQESAPKPVTQDDPTSAF